MKRFQDFGLHQLLSEGLERMGYQEPTPIQEQTIPLALTGQDILGSAQTGTGKTAAFMIPLIAQLLKDSQKTALVLTPTRELAAQVATFTQKLVGRKSAIETVLLIGGEPMGPQLYTLKKRPRIVVGTPGRVNDHLVRGSLSLHKTGVFVLDEADRMLDMGFGIQIEAIAEHLPAERQTLLFSATLPAAIVRLTQTYLNNPAQVHINATHAPAANIQQDTLNVTSETKLPELLKELDKRSGSVIIFVKTKFGAEKLSRSLRDEGHSTDFLHGDLRQNRRSRVIKNFREQKHRIMIATDVAARGLDIPHIEHVINYDLPQCPEDYVHRIGRTARAGAKGFSLCLIAPQDRRLWAAIQHMLDPKKHQRAGAERSSFGERRGGYRSGGRNSNSSNRSFFERRTRDNGFPREERGQERRREDWGAERRRDERVDRQPSSNDRTGDRDRKYDRTTHNSTNGYQPRQRPHNNSNGTYYRANDRNDRSERSDRNERNDRDDRFGKKDRKDNTWFNKSGRVGSSDKTRA